MSFAWMTTSKGLRTDPALRRPRRRRVFEQRGWNDRENPSLVDSARFPEEKRENQTGGESGSPRMRSDKSAKNGLNSHNASGIKRLRRSRCFGFFRPFTTVFGFCQRDVTRYVTWRGERRQPPRGHSETSLSRSRWGSGRIRTRSRSMTAKLPAQSSRDVRAATTTRLSLSILPVQPNQHDTAPRRQPGSKREFTEVFVESHNDPELGLCMSEHVSILGARHGFFNREHVVCLLAQGCHDGSGYVLVGEKPHAAAQPLTVNMRSERITSPA